MLHIHLGHYSDRCAMNGSPRAHQLVELRARVRFDADGSALDREWSWITPDAGWLVYDHDLATATLCRDRVTRRRLPAGGRPSIGSRLRASRTRA